MASLPTSYPNIMTDSTSPRLSASHLEDMAYVALTARAEAETLDLFPALADKIRSKLRSRLKQFARHDWPSSMQEDAAIRRGYTWRQCCRLIAALLMMDGHLTPSTAIPICRNNELAILRAIAARIGGEAPAPPSPTDPLIVLILGELWEQVDEAGSTRANPSRLRLVERRNLGDLWSADADLHAAGQRLVVDVGTAAETAWRWISERRLMPPSARHDLLDDLREHAGEPGFQVTPGRTLRR